MHIISRKLFLEAALKFPACAAALDATYRMLNGREFADPEALQSFFLFS